MTTPRNILAALVIASIALFPGCPAGKRLSTQEMTGIAPAGRYSLLLFGCRYPDDILNAVFLDKEGDLYQFDMYAPEHDFSVLNGVPAPEARARAENFIGCSFNLEGSQLREIVGPEGAVIGYEVRPLYSPLRYGTRDVMHINYYLQDRTVMIFIKLDPRVEALLNSRDLERNSGRK